MCPWSRYGGGGGGGGGYNGGGGGGYNGGGGGYSGGECTAAYARVLVNANIFRRRWRPSRITWSRSWLGEELPGWRWRFHIFNNFYFSFLTKIQEWIEHSTTAIKILI